VVGCSASGVIGAGRGVEREPAVSVWAAVLPGAQIRSYHLEVIRMPEGMAVVGMPERAASDTAALLFADPYSFPADGFVEQSNSALNGLPMIGGLATGPGGAGSTRLFVDGRSVERGAVGVVIGGDVGAVPVVSQGCRPVGPAMTVTKAESNVVLEIAGMPALAKLEEIVASLDPVEQAMVTTGLQFGIVMDEYAEEYERGDFLVRGIVGADRDRGALVVGDVVEVGRTVRFQVRDATAAEDDLRERLDRLPPAAGAAAARIEGALLVSCNGRGTPFFGDASHDVRAVRRLLRPDGGGVGGFFGAGEIGPVSGRNHLHGFTAAILAFRSAGGPAR
jgi:small ligand-binding sensory domain FIST